MNIIRESEMIAINYCVNCGEQPEFKSGTQYLAGDLVINEYHCSYCKSKFKIVYLDMQK